MVIPVMTGATDYVKEVQALLRTNEFHADVDLSANTLNKKIRSAQLLQYNFIFGERKKSNVRKNMLESAELTHSVFSPWCEGDD